ncbi:MAG: LysM peptidoglycan-binding domain-containing protein [Rubrobacteraceae bacterium]|nr:LysM peptidoglycan-binding domain-containing protein [Rubrobacteraceae bacterium]
MSLRLKRSGGALLGATLAVMLAAMMLALSPAVAEAQTEDKNTSSVVVRPGDSLWSISEGRLGPNATPQQIYNETARIYALNRERIGEDPNLIYAGEVLLLKPAREPVDAPAVAGRPGRGARPAVSERASKKVAAPEPSRQTAQRTSRDLSRDLAREPSDVPTHQLPELARPPIPEPVAEPAPKAASDEVLRWLPQGRLLLAALVGIAAVWGAMGLILVVALMAWKLPMRRTTREDAERWGIPTPYYGAEATYRIVTFAHPPGSLGGGDTRDARKRTPQAPEALGHKQNGDASAGSRNRKAAVAGRGRTRRAKKAGAVPRNGLALGAHSPDVRRAAMRARILRPPSWVARRPRSPAADKKGGERP